jgi:PAS domain S-box-containing protein
MNIYALLSLIASAICIPLGVSVYLLNRKSTVNQLFLLIMWTNAYWAFGQFMLTQSATAATAAFWGKAIFLWPFLIALVVHFTLAFTESDLLKNKLIYVVLYFPAWLFALIDVSTNWISLDPVLKSWGYSYNVPINSVVSRIDGVWAGVVMLLALFLFANYYNRIVDNTRKQQTKFVTIAFGIPILLDLVTDSLFPIMGIDFPGLGAISGSLTSFFVVYAMVKYELFGFRPEIAMENVFSTILDSVILVNLQGIIVKGNRAFVENSGYSEKDLVGKSISEITQKSRIFNNTYTTQQIMAELLKRRDIKNLDITFYSESGQKRTGTMSCSMVHDSRGKDVGVAFVLHDTTEQKEMEQKLIKSERLASIGELAGILGHDLRNPLMGIRGAAYYLKTKHANSLDSNDEEMFDSIDKSINYSDKIVNDLIDYSTEINLILEAISPKSLVNGTLALTALPKNIAVVDETTDLPQFQVDVEKIRRGFLNIIKNAFDAMPEGGELVISSQKIGEAVVFSFKDSGDGMTKETLDKLWMPLFTTKAKGMGFGLAICKRTVEAHGGKISAESAVKEGTTIKVELPLNLQQPQNNESSLFL